jgi:polyphosphate kinase
MILIVRREEGRLRRYVHLGTGNYHAGNARLYTDYSFMTCDESISDDVNKLFQQLTGMGKALKIKKLFHAPFTLHARLLSLIDREAGFGEKGRIILKFNALTEIQLIKALYRASQAGVKIDLIIRGICCLRPEVPGLSENIRVRSIIGRFLEHTRVYYFGNNGRPDVYCSSADGMERNLLSRVETAFPLDDPDLAARVREDLDTYLADNCQSWVLQPDGSYIQNQPAEGEERLASQLVLLERLTGKT